MGQGVTDGGTAQGPPVPNPAGGLTLTGGLIQGAPTAKVPGGETLTVVVGGSAPRVRSGGGATAAPTRTADGCETAAFGSTVPAIMQADDPETAAQGGGTTAGGVRPVAKAATDERTPAEQAGTWVLAVIGFGGVLGAGGAGSLATWLLTRRRGLGA